MKTLIAAIAAACVVSVGLAGDKSAAAARAAYWDFQRTIDRSREDEQRSEYRTDRMREQWHQDAKEAAREHKAELKAEKAQHLETKRQMDLQTKEPPLTVKTLCQDYLGANGLTNVLVRYRPDQHAGTMNYMIECNNTNEQAAVWKVVKSVPDRVRISQETNSVFLIVHLPP